ncbi:PDDEXK-like family protein [Hymenobacter mucosus]|uniref:PD-(D/E)XK nuclease superfamily protein n=1 Tax=Hymenobacter mucosus TaxID=1411120 RepID=A0A238X2H1_9BACT|nr:PD-(D/E)XK nuclease family protein [Hymenobacter mucosus]SNR52880.1 PD-(D/E)XK nuclease superfamily protein [Hymenobacter mucosus]
MSEIIACLQAVEKTIVRIEHENRLVNRYTARDFTPFRFMPQGEVPTTHLLAFFLNAHEDHGQEHLFQELFIKRLRQEHLVSNRLPVATWTVKAERRHGEYGQLDLLLTATDGSFGICIENKPRDGTKDQPGQLTRYRQLLMQRHGENYLLIYLSRDARPPDPISLTAEDREALTGKGQYLNLTFREFLLGLLDDWYQAVHPESLRTFIRQFRHHVESWLQFESTKPAQLMQAKEVASTIISASQVQTAFDIIDSLAELKTQLLTTLAKKLAECFPEFAVGEHWKDTGFLQAINRKPIIIRRPTTSEVPDKLPWGRYSIGVEFDNGRLFYGIRFDRANLSPTDTTEQDWPEETPNAIAQLLSKEARPWSWWPWWDWVGPENDHSLYPLIANGKLVSELAPRVEELIKALDRHCQVGSADASQ